jgi:CRISPR-associated protein Cas6
MFWNEEEKSNEFSVPNNVIDLSFKVTCKQIQLDHAWALTNAITKLLPWFIDEPQAAIHHIYIPQAGNGWLCSDNFNDEIIQLSRRTRLKIRIPHHRLKSITTLIGKTIFINDNSLTFGQAEQHLLSNITTIVARHVHIIDTDNDETLFLQKAHQQIQEMGINVRKMLCGKSHYLKTSTHKIKTRSLMIADISAEESICLQENGVGSHYSYGCGIFIPQKGITAVNNSD